MSLLYIKKVTKVFGEGESATHALRGIDLTINKGEFVAMSLVVGGIGVMNIMLVSVTERTREIGLRKALGATNNSIMFQFIIEAVILTISGGIIGIILGSILSMLSSIGLSEYMNINWSTTFPFYATLIGVLVSSSVGIIFGSYPAYKAFKKNPIEALRYE